jgi:hypothetical protein
MVGHDTPGFKVVTLSIEFKQYILEELPFVENTVSISRCVCGGGQCSKLYLWNASVFLVLNLISPNIKSSDRWRSQRILEKPIKFFSELSTVIHFVESLQDRDTLLDPFKVLIRRPRAATFK